MREYFHSKQSHLKNSRVIAIAVSLWSARATYHPTFDVQYALCRILICLRLNSHDNNSILSKKTKRQQSRISLPCNIEMPMPRHVPFPSGPSCSEGLPQIRNFRSAPD